MFLTYISGELATRRIRGRFPQVLIDCVIWLRMSVATPTSRRHRWNDRPADGVVYGVLFNLNDIATLTSTRPIGGHACERLSAGVRELRATLSGTVHPLAAMDTRTAAGELLSGIRVHRDLSDRNLSRQRRHSTEAFRRSRVSSNLSDATFQVNLSDKRIQGRIPEVRIDLSAVAPDIRGTVSLAAEIDGTMINRPLPSQGSLQASILAASTSTALIWKERLQRTN